MSLSLDVVTERYEIAGGFRIARGARTHAEVVVATLSEGRLKGRGECLPYARYDESLDSVTEQILDMAGALAGGLDREGLRRAMPAGAARNALDCALWDLEAKRAGARVWELAGLPAPRSTPTAFTLGIDTPDLMRAKAAANAHRPLLKVKLGGPADDGGAGDLARLRAVREGAPQATIIVDANEGWRLADYQRLAPEMTALGVAMVEQPLPAGDDDALEGVDRPLPVCADEACHDRETLPALTGRYDMINIKLDKTGGLTEALALRDEARAMGFQVMVGCMLATSLAMAPALIVAQGAEIVDLDGPLLLSKDREHGLVYDEHGAHAPSAKLWG
ncbi:N-acetyl-D-Glu racemase DgcA [Rubrimonas cliftonensis]|uniref:Dipeptide epimerase n=1 Tax=Rubrimonas cliftonensis TaxID=89524 RepID=A0A1H4AGD5_9RHOB|nr:N-acetyl-D-Glu racemase DgcA [Rubrimonas cliftonensis]SEA34937.1 L-alanine-DL-glutamate epimerase [Rubrimonas cliftonensis]